MGRSHEDGTLHADVEHPLLVAVVKLLEQTRERSEQCRRHGASQRLFLRSDEGKRLLLKLLERAGCICTYNRPLLTCFCVCRRPLSCRWSHACLLDVVASGLLPPLPQRAEIGPPPIDDLVCMTAARVLHL